jgi:hypothetical protein
MKANNPAVSTANTLIIGTSLYYKININIIILYNIILYHIFSLRYSEKKIAILHCTLGIDSTHSQKLFL